MIDEKINTLQAIITSLEKQKKGFMQKLFSRELRFRDETGEEFPEWEEKRLGEFVHLHNGRAYFQNELLESGKTPVLRVGNFFCNSNWYYSNLVLDESKYANHGDLLYAWSASFGPRIWIGEKVIYHYHIWKVTHSDVVLKQFLYYWFFYDVKYLTSKMNGGTMMHITKEFMETRQISLPSKNEQRKIAGFLAIIDKKIDIEQQKLAHWQTIKKGLLQQMFV